MFIPSTPVCYKMYPYLYILYVYLKDVEKLKVILYFELLDLL